MSGPFAISLVKVKTGETRQIDTVSDWEKVAGIFADETGYRYCDCERESLFGPPWPTDPDSYYCGHERFRLFVTRADGVIVYDEREGR